MTNAVYLHFTAPATGTCVVVAPDSINVPEVKASSIRVGNNEEVVIDSSGVRVNNQYLATTQQVNAVNFNAWLVATSQKLYHKTLLLARTTMVRLLAQFLFLMKSMLLWNLMLFGGLFSVFA